jgi:L-ascorbate metabolism protein UlaG (beta-lactamase superfamily)
MSTVNATPKITYIGHATVLVEMDGVRLLTDPLLRNWVWHLRRQHKNVDQGWYQHIDMVLISHMHSDHLDIGSLKLLGRDTRIIVPVGVARRLHKHGFKNVEEVSIGEMVMVGSVTVTATQALHDGARFRFGHTADCVGYIIAGSRSFYFAGDTDLFPEMADLTDALDIALLPVWGWGPTLGAGHLDPYRAALALQLLQPKVAIPIHWGTFFPAGLKWFLPRLLADPPHSFSKFAAGLASDVKVHVVHPGNYLHVDENIWADGVDTT